MSDSASTPLCPRPEHPRPDRRRPVWQNLNGTWDFAFDDAGTGLASAWEQGPTAWNGRRDITVPFAWQSPASGIADDSGQVRAWYHRSFDLDGTIAADLATGKRLLLHFGAVDYRATVWLNGVRLGEHEGGYTPFFFDIGTIVRPRDNRLVVLAEDLPDPAQPRGKQAWYAPADRCWYTPSSGIWQTVWLESVGESHIGRFFLTPDIEARTLEVELEVEHWEPGTAVELRASHAGRPVCRLTVDLTQNRQRVVLAIAEADKVDEIHHWTPDTPQLYDLDLRLVAGGREIDRVETYFAMRSIRVVNGAIYLNNRPFYQRLVLDQGYWRESLLTPPSDEAIAADVRLTKELGFNGARKHQKIEDPRYYYWADRLGLVVWGELPSPYEFCRAEIGNTVRDWQAFIERDYNHPCIVAWVPFNESWGVRNIVSDRRQQALARSLAELAKAWDPTRLLSANDGWECVDSDFIGLHDYCADPTEITAKLANLERQLEGSFGGNRRALADRTCYQGQPVMVTEFGGIAFAGESGWGYFGAVSGEAAFLERFAGTIRALDDSGRLAGWCYTQLTDVFQEANGLLDMDRRPKVAPGKLRPLIRGEGGLS